MRNHRQCLPILRKRQSAGNNNHPPPQNARGGTPPRSCYFQTPTPIFGLPGFSILLVMLLRIPVLKIFSGSLSVFLQGREHWWFGIRHLIGSKSICSALYHRFTENTMLNLNLIYSPCNLSSPLFAAWTPHEETTIHPRHASIVTICSYNYKRPRLVSVSPLLFHKVGKTSKQQNANPHNHSRNSSLSCVICV